MAFGERMGDLAQVRPEAQQLLESVVLRVSGHIAYGIAAECDALHVVGQHPFRDSHQREGMQHSDEEVLLPGIGEELHVTVAAVVADHHETRALPVIALFNPPPSQSPSPSDSSRLPQCTSDVRLPDVESRQALQSGQDPCGQ